MAFHRARTATQEALHLVGALAGLGTQTWTALLSLLFLLPVATGVAAEPPDARILPPTPQQWADLAKLPDWSGVWTPDIGDQFWQAKANQPPWNARAAARVSVMLKDEAAGRPHGIFTNCLPYGMPGLMLITHNALEFLFTPGRVTILGESDGNRLRRVYTDGRSHAVDPDPSFHGDSIGHWEGDTLVVDTVGIYPETLIAISEAVGVPNDGGLQVAERIHLVSKDLMQDDLTITAPHVLTKPWVTARVFHRERARKFEIQEGECLQGRFREDIDKNGDAVWVPMKFTAEGVPVP